MVQHDLTQPIGMILGDPDSTGPLPSDASVVFTMSQADGSKRVTGPGVIDDPVAWAVHYQWLLGDTDVAGVFYAQWTILYGGASPETFPSDEPFYVIVHPAL
jgi:hypothetical protein